MRIDIREFYPSVSHDVIKRRLAERIRKREVSTLLLRAISTPTVADGAPKKAVPGRRGVPQGLAISNLLAELVAQAVDDKFSHDRRLDYFRFVDDVLLLCNASDVTEVYEDVVQAFEAIGLTAHSLDVGETSKSQIGRVAEGFDYLGYLFADSGISVRPSSVRRLESALARAYTRYARSVAGGQVDPETAERALAKCKWDVDLIVSGCVYKGVSRGWIAYFRQMDDLKLLKRLDATVARFSKRFAMPRNFSSKSFMRAYWILRHPRGESSRYIPNFDSYSLDQMRGYLLSVAGLPNADRMPDDMVRDEFFRLIGREVATLEMDVGTVS